MKMGLPVLEGGLPEIKGGLSAIEGVLPAIVLGKGTWYTVSTSFVSTKHLCIGVIYQCVI